MLKYLLGNNYNEIIQKNKMSIMKYGNIIHSPQISTEIFR